MNPDDHVVVHRAAKASAFTLNASLSRSKNWARLSAHRCWALIVAGLLLPLATGTAAPATFFGSCAASASDLNGANLKITRYTLNWAAIQPHSGDSPEWNALGNDATDDVVGALLDSGCDVVLIAGAKWPAWAGTNPTAAEVAAFASAAAQHYYGLRNKKIFMEIMNEPNGTLSGDTATIATLYKNILAQSKTAIRSVLNSSQVVIVGVVLAGTPWMQNASDVDAFWTGITTGPNPVQNNMDILSYHMYAIPAVGETYHPPEVGTNRGGPLMDRLVNSKTKIDATGFAGVVWATEGGWPTDTGEKPPTTEARQARWLVRMAVVMKGFDLKRFIQFRFQDKGNLNYGLVHVDGVSDPKPSYAAYQTMCGVIDSTVTSTTVVQYDAAGTCIYKYTKSNGDYGYIIWRVKEGDSGSAVVTVGTNGHLYKKTLTQTGSWTDLGVHSGNYSLTAINDPIYIEVR